MPTAVHLVLKRFRVTMFRSVADSGWIDVDDVTALIGTNESGKSNLLLPLWKLNPAKDGEIHATSDFPRKHYTTIRNAETKPVFIEAEFEPSSDMRKRLAPLCGVSEDLVKTVRVKRRLDGTYEVEFPQLPATRTVPSTEIATILEAARTNIASMEPMKSEQEIAAGIQSSIDAALGILEGVEECTLAEASQVFDALAKQGVEGSPKTSSIAPRFQRLREEIDALTARLAKPHPNESEKVMALLLARLPHFVYYSNYGNLDSEIYLPHVIENLQRGDDLGQKERAKARTLKVLFEFVDLQPSEIQELGRDVHAQGHKPTPAQVEESAERKKERSILLQSASTRLTELFRLWWKQGDYRFRFEADGDHFRIWVADDRRPEEVELEGRSTGLQWFLSFFLVFLVESQDTHSGCILLLDEPGLSLHPLAQRDLSDFFDGLAERNQLLYTTHSPFLVDADRLDRARKVYVAPDGTSKATSDLGADGGDPTRRGAGYAVHAAIGLSVAEGLLIGCESVVVEGPSDQHYLTAMKTILIRDGLLTPGRELVFPPAGGAKGIKAVASILGGRDEALPLALLDSDTQGNLFAKGLRTGLYEADPDRVLQVGSFVDLEGAEVEDMIPVNIIVTVVDRLIREPEALFESQHDPKKPIVPQIEAWATAGGAVLEKGWKVDIAKRVKRALLDGAAVPDGTLEQWQNMFAAFQSGSDTESN